MSHSAMTPSLELGNFEAFAGRRALTPSISLVHQIGRLLWLTGENGAGKSSILRALAGRGRYRGRLLIQPAPADLRDIAYYAPEMRFPARIRVRDWLRLHHEWVPNADGRADLLLPQVDPASALAELSTGEAKRFQLWAVLRLKRSFYFLDEPYEHLSPAAKSVLTDQLFAIMQSALIIVATNQDRPAHDNSDVIEVG